MIEVEVRGGAELRACAAQLRAEADELRRNIVEAAERGTRGLVRSIADAAPSFLPDHYVTAALNPSLRSKTTTHFGVDPGVSVRIWAIGRTEQRDLRAINAGRLRHPLFGNRLHWYGQRVRRGFVTTTFRRQRDDIVREIDKELDRVRERVERG